MPSLHDKLIGNADRINSVKVIDPKIDSILNDMEEIPVEVTAGSKWAVDAWVALGRPETPFTESGAKLVEILIGMWEELYPQDAREWYEARRDYKKEEMDITEQVHQKTGRSLASYPYQLFMVMKRFFPNVKLGDRKTCMKMVRRFPMFRFANKA